MAFYDLPKQERTNLVTLIGKELEQALKSNQKMVFIGYFGDEDTYIRKSAYLSLAKTYFRQQHLQYPIIHTLDLLLTHADFKIRQTVINTAGEIAKKEFETVQHIFDKGLFDPHHSPRNAVIGSIKKAGAVNPKPILDWAGTYLHHENAEIRREICHGIELRDREHPQEILPLLKELQGEKTARVRNTLIHVLGQIAYKKNCLSTVVAHLKTWNNKALVAEALEEIIDVHYRYRNFAAMTQEEARSYISNNF